MPGTTNQKLSESQATACVSRWIGAAQIQMDRGFSTTAELTLNPQEHLFMSGDIHTHVYQVLEGVVGVYQMLADGRRQIVSFYYPGDLINVTTQHTSKHHAEALCNTRVRSIPTKTIETLMVKDPEFGLALLNTLATELSETRDQLLSLGCKSALEKLSTFLLRISRRNAREGSDKTKLYLPMTRSEIGDYLGLTIETVSRNMTKLRVSGVVKLISKSKLEILNINELEKLANGVG